MRIYMPGEKWDSGEFASLLAIGDSWFWYPRNNVLQALAGHPRLKDPYRMIQSLGYNGAKLEQYVFGKHAKQLDRELRPQNRMYYSAVLVSGAGNDAVDYRLGLFRDCAGKSAPDQCIDDEGMDEMLGRLGTALGALIYRVRRAFAKDGRQPDIFLHTYDYPVPDGRGFSLASLKVTGPWLAAAMDERRVAPDMELRRAICRTLIDRLRDEFARYADAARKIHLIDSRGCLVAPDYEDDWDNELHPTVRGFDRIVDQRWMPVLAGLGYAR